MGRERERRKGSEGREWTIEREGKDIRLGYNWGRGERRKSTR